MTVGEGDAAHAAGTAVGEGYDHVFVAGGDGTLNEAVNGVGATPGGFESVTFGIIPLGTGNDFATALGIPSDVEEALAAVTGGDRVAVDVGKLNNRYFINVSAGGFIAEVSDAVDPKLKTLAGKLAYLIGGAHVSVQLQARGRAGAHIRADETANLTLTLFAVCNSRLIGGGRLIAPEARIDDGLFDVCLIEGMPTMEFLALLKRVSDGEHVGDGPRCVLPHGRSGTDVHAPYESEYRRRGRRGDLLSLELIPGALPSSRPGAKRESMVKAGPGIRTADAGADASAYC